MQPVESHLVTKGGFSRAGIKTFFSILGMFPLYKPNPKEIKGWKLMAEKIDYDRKEPDIIL